MDIAEIRTKIDAIDSDLLKLFLQRMALMRDVVDYKTAHNLPVVDKVREREVLAQMMDKAGEVAEIARGVPGVVTVHKVRVRRYGGAFAADLHVHVDGGLSVAEGHDIGHAVSGALIASGIGVTDAVVHVEPDRRIPRDCSTTLSAATQLRTAEK